MGSNGDLEPPTESVHRRVAVFGPSPLLEVSIEDGAVPLRVLAGGQAVWVSRMAATMGCRVTVCGLSGGRVGALVDRLLEEEPYERRRVDSQASSGCFVVDQRSEPAIEVASAWAPAPSTDEVEALLRATYEVASETDVLAVCNPMPGDALPLATYSRLVRWAAEHDLPVVADLSTPRIDAALAGGPVHVKINDWELAELVSAPVGEPPQWHRAAQRLLAAGASSVVVTRGASSTHAVGPDGSWFEIEPPFMGSGRAAGCGDAWTGAFAAALAQGVGWLDAVVLAMAAGAAHYVGRDESSRAAIDALSRRVTVRAVTD
jgi:fructose-1-phosphate kinase PfkB-like protein